VNNKTKSTTSMRMAELQAGLGFGVKKFHPLWVFGNQQALDKPDLRAGRKNEKGAREEPL
jgi:hypothetical protein